MKKTISFEDGIKRIGEILDILENRNTGLDESLALYEEGMKLLKTCSMMLDSAEQKVELLKNSFEASPVTVSFSGDTANENQ